jgi:hypothetical protein
MPTGNGSIRALNGLGRAGLMPAPQNGGRKETFIERFDLADAAVQRLINDDNLVCDLPEGVAILSIKVSSTVSLTTSQLRFGTKSSPALYGAAKAYGTTAEAVIEYLNTAQRGVPLAARVRLFMGILSANLPSSGIIVVEVETSARG